MRLAARDGNARARASASGGRPAFARSAGDDGAKAAPPVTHAARRAAARKPCRMVVPSFGAKSLPGLPESCLNVPLDVACVEPNQRESRFRILIRTGSRLLLYSLNLRRLADFGRHRHLGQLHWPKHRCAPTRRGRVRGRNAPGDVCAPRAARPFPLPAAAAACRAAHSYSLCIPGCIAAGVRRVGAALMFVIVATLIAASIGLLDWFRSDVAVLSLCGREWVGWGAVHGGAAPLGTAPTAALCTPSERARQAWQRLTCPCREQRATDCDMGGRHS